MDEVVEIQTTKIPEIYGVGRLGAMVPAGFTDRGALAAALDMAERRILRLEEALRRAGIEVGMTELPQ